MNCKNCGYAITQDDQFCKSCGTPTNISVQNNEGVGTSVNQSVSQPMSQPTQPVQPTQQMYQQPMNTQSNNYQPSYQQQKNNNNNAIKFVLIGVGVLVVIALIIFAISNFSNKSNVGSNVGNEGGNIAASSSSTYTVKNGEFTYKIPTDLVYQVQGDTLYISDEKGTWVSMVAMMQGAFSQLTEANITANLQSAGYNVINSYSKKFNGIDFLISEINYQGTNELLAYAKATSMHIIGLEIVNQANEIDTNLLEKLAPIVNTIEHTGSGNNITTGGLDIKGIAGLAQ